MLMAFQPDETRRGRAPGRGWKVIQASGEPERVRSRMVQAAQELV